MREAVCLDTVLPTTTTATPAGPQVVPPPAVRPERLPPPETHTRTPPVLEADALTRPFQGVLIRGAAWLLDFAFFVAPVLLLFIKVNGIEHFETSRGGLVVFLQGPLAQLDEYEGLVAFQLLLPIFFAWLTADFGGTPGKLLCGIRVVDAATGRHLSFGRACLREFLRYLLYFAVLLVGWVLALFSVFAIAMSPQRSAIHDAIARSFCIKRQEPIPFAAPLPPASESPAPEPPHIY